ncbi:MAG: N-acetylmuramoyl-L-alanine amidase [Bacteroidetes bacterium]|nr:MAG: N-acetylmuramoyl-L-alanine amidase [Bacteroidota bacterium]
MKSLALFAFLSLVGSTFALFDSDDSPVLIINAGHGGKDPGSIVGNLEEADLNLAWATTLKNQAEERGMEVMMIRENDEYLDLKTRIERANSFDGKAILLSIHMNDAGEHTDKNGAMLYTKIGCSDEEILLRDEMVAHLSTFREVNIEEGEFYVLKNSVHPSLIINPGFMSNASDLANLQSPDYMHSFLDLALNSIQE